LTRSSLVLDRQIYKIFGNSEKALEKNKRMNDLKFSLFYDHLKGIQNTKPRKEITAAELVRIYRSQRIKEVTEELKRAPKEAKQRLKLQLPFFTPYGTFTQRRNELLQHHNTKLIALDFDGLDRPNAEKVKRKLMHQDCTLLAAISPRGNGVKALILSAEGFAPETRYNTLKQNAANICGMLTIYEYKEQCDRAQFVLCQPMFIAHDPELYYNENPKAKDFNLKAYEPPQIEHQDRTILAPSFQSNRIEQYLLNASNRLYNELTSTKEGTRHHSIIKVQKIASWLHYAPHLESEIKSSLFNAVCAMYGGHKQAERHNAINSFNKAWNEAPHSANKTIEAIIYELQKTA
jgi:hypothetical protein